jgi:hypothetical protein
MEKSKELIAFVRNANVKSEDFSKLQVEKAELASKELDEALKPFDEEGKRLADMCEEFERKIKEVENAIFNKYKKELEEIAAQELNTTGKKVCEILGIDSNNLIDISGGMFQGHIEGFRNFGFVYVVTKIDEISYTLKLVTVDEEKDEIINVHNHDFKLDKTNFDMLMEPVLKLIRMITKNEPFYEDDTIYKAIVGEERWTIALSSGKNIKGLTMKIDKIIQGGIKSVVDKLIKEIDEKDSEVNTDGAEALSNEQQES